MSDQTKAKIDQFANGKAWRILADRCEDYVIRIGEHRVWCVRKCNADRLGNDLY